MGIFSKLFKKTENQENIVKREGHPDVIYVKNEDERMAWAIEKANFTINYFEKSLKHPTTQQQYFAVKVKIVDNDYAEHIWLTSPSFDEDENLFGTVGNAPVNVATVSEGQRIGIDRKLISDWMIIENGRLIGGYTIRAIRDGLTTKELPDFDKSIGVFIDEGVDYFEHDFSTPEGAILSLEDAYNSDNIEKALECKDFYQEAKLMLEKMKGLPFDSETINSTAEVLKLSFIKYLHEDGIPKFRDVERAFQREKVDDDHYVIIEYCLYPDKYKSQQKLLTFKSKSGWKVLNPLS